LANHLRRDAALKLGKCSNGLAPSTDDHFDVYLVMFLPRKGKKLFIWSCLSGAKAKNCLFGDAAGTQRQKTV